MTDIILFWQNHNKKPVFSEADWSLYFEREAQAKKAETARIRSLAEYSTYSFLKNFYKRKK